MITESIIRVSEQTGSVFVLISVVFNSELFVSLCAVMSTFRGSLGNCVVYNGCQLSQAQACNTHARAREGAGCGGKRNQTLCTTMRTFSNKFGGSLRPEFSFVIQKKKKERKKKLRERERSRFVNTSARHGEQRARLQREAACWHWPGR